jgi:hypothetical protein
VVVQIPCLGIFSGFGDVPSLFVVVKIPWLGIFSGFGDVPSLLVSDFENVPSLWLVILPAFVPKQCFGRSNSVTKFLQLGSLRPRLHHAVVLLDIPAYYS